MGNNSGINCQELSALVRILNRALTADDRVNFIDWVDDAYDSLEESANNTSIDNFKSILLTQCVILSDRMPASEKFNCKFFEFMTADELSPFQASTGEDLNPLVSEHR